MISRFAFAAAAAGILGGCGPSGGSLPYPLTVTSEGLGAIHPQDPFDPKAVEMKLPGFNVEKVSPITPSDPEPILILKRGGTTIAYLSPDSSGETIAQISVVSPLVRDKRGQGIADTIQQTPDLVCKRNLCRYHDDSRLIYQIDPQTGTIREITVQKL